MQLNPTISFGEQLALFSPMIALTCTMLAIVAVPIVAGRRTQLVAGVSTFGVIVTLLLTISVLGRLGEGVTSMTTADSAGMLVADKLSLAFQAVLWIFLLAVTWMWRIGSADTEKDAPEFFILLLGSALGMALMVSTVNLLMIVLAIELASLPSYAIVGFDKKDRRAAEASLKYVIFGAISAAIMIYGASLLYGLAGTLDITLMGPRVLEAFAPDSSQRLLAGVALLCILAGIAFKISAVPFHFWCPDVFEGAKIEVTTWLSVVSKAAGLILLVRLVAVFSAAPIGTVYMDPLVPIAWGIGIMAIITCTVGNFAAYVQTSVKRLLAYSSIAHAGYMMMAAAIFMHPSQLPYGDAISALLAYVLVYMFMNLGAFAVTAVVFWDTGSDHIEAFTGLIRRSPWLAVPMVVCLMSLVGLPPLAGFIVKYWLLIALGQLNSPLGWVLVTVAVVNTLISLYFYLRIVVQMTLRDDGRRPVHTPFGGAAIVNLCAVALFVLFVLASPLRTMATRYSRDLYLPDERKSRITADAVQATEEVADAR